MRDLLRTARRTISLSTARFGDVTAGWTSGSKRGQAGVRDEGAMPDASEVGPAGGTFPLLPGEPQDVQMEEDAEVWASIYEELTEFLGHLHVEADQPSPGLETDNERLQARLQAMSSRRAYWQQRRASLRLVRERE